MSDRYIAKVAALIDEWSVVINKGANDGIPSSGMLRIVRLGLQEVFDPDTGKSLGRLEHLIGRVEIYHQDEQKTIVRTISSPSAEPVRNLGIGLLGSYVQPTAPPLLPAKVGDLVVRE